VNEQLRKRVALVLASASAALFVAVAPSTGAESDSVVLLHGLWRSDRSMCALEARLARAGFRVHNLRYPSTAESPEGLVANLDRQITECCARAPRLHFVTHSLGGILARAYLAEHPLPNLGRVVMLAPPNRGSKLADVARESEALRAVLGPTGALLGTGPASLPNRLPPPSFVFGVIAGTRSANPVSALVLAGENDGTVSVESTKLPGMADFVTVPSTHTLIVRSELAAAHTIEFLRRGHFLHGAR
jgi:pimeloyl-ACP methyl ester carboxylesterase